MTSAGLQLQKALLKLLKSDIALNERVHRRVYDHVPEQAVFPYITLGTTSTYDWSTFTERGSEHFLTLHIWNRGTGRKTVFEIMGRLDSLAVLPAFKLEGHRLVSFTLEQSQTFSAESHGGYAGIMRYRAMTEEL
ncbi:DUF3168 domain-containing protein [Phyllobacterium sp. OV277]|uniref:DUF3168 domain-containing protein n=1 Tax=Phyllobacterium sp. OV277 TaxID=1882772 RepID=UPI000884548D|nr:DUF3168 domain-containing protein [Phyllobacterium sp. OV277]SDP03832.1 Protein of unknown function [Phyllobacterium sp. OV277]